MSSVAYVTTWMRINTNTNTVLSLPPKNSVYKPSLLPTYTSAASQIMPPA
jgi:hypothetical protein